MNVESVQYYNSTVSDLVLPTKRYTPLNRPPIRDGIVLFFAHGTGMHKEQWEPTIEYTIQRANVQEAWSFDWPNHGEGAMLNAQVIAARYPEGTALWDWGKLIAGFHKERGFDPRRTFAIGHSAGCSALIYSTKEFQLTAQPYAAMIHVETTMISRELFVVLADFMHNALGALHRNISKRRERWPSRATAKEWFSKRMPWCEWDPRILALFVDHALCPTGEGEEVRLLLSGAQETSGYSVLAQNQAMDQYMLYGEYMPVHFVFGERNTMVPRVQQDSYLDPVASGRAPTSVHRVPGAGHLVVQEKPDMIAAIVLSIIQQYPQAPTLPIAKL